MLLLRVILGCMKWLFLQLLLSWKMKKLSIRPFSGRAEEVIKEEHTVAYFVFSLLACTILRVLIKRKQLFRCPGWPRVSFMLPHTIFRKNAFHCLVWMRVTSLAFLVTELFCWKRQPTLPGNIKGRQGAVSSGVLHLCGHVSVWLCYCWY